MIIYTYILWQTQVTWYTAKPRNLSGITIITRSTRINDESIIYKRVTTTTTGSQDNEDEETIKTPTKGNIINSYLKTTFPDQVLIDGIISQINGKSLIRSRGYKNKKTHIVVHHTASDNSTLKTPEDARKAANDIFKYHTQKKWRWDIWYNFIIDPWGNIYEGRWWWESVIWAHASYNNAASLWIALMGNFEINEPTSGQLNSLARLATALMIRYQINPDSEVYAHILDDHDPYIRDVVRSSFMGHKDTGKTACPGSKLYKKLSIIMQAIRTQLLIQKKIFPLKKVRKIINYTSPLNFDTNQWTFSIKQNIKNRIIACRVYSTALTVNCKKTDNGVIITLTKKKDQLASGPMTIDIDTSDKNETYKITTNLRRKSDETLLLNQRKQSYIKAHNIKSITNKENKFKKDIDLTEIKDLIQKDISVLLYEASTSLSSWKFLCQQCTVQDDKGIIYPDSSFTITNNGTSLTYTSKNQIATISSISITPKQSTGTTFITNYARKSYVGIAWNNFYGTITISQQPLIKIGESKPITQYVLTNSLPFDLYLRWIAESTDSEPLEKIKAMTLISKNYILFYLDPAHKHPNIPVWATYNAVDDARIFQKYAGAGIDSTLKLRKSALEYTKHQVVMYNNNLAFLPYFSCSAGFTRSASEKYWWTDTPYLTSVYDPAPCKDFSGHGVGLAGNGASQLAKDGDTYEQIIQHFYPGVTIQNY